MKIKIEMNVKNICFIVIIAVCVLALSYGIYYQIFIKKTKAPKEPDAPVVIEDVAFNDLFDNSLHLQNYTTSHIINKIEQTKDIVYTTFTLNEIYEDKYEIQASIPVININHEKTLNINKEINTLFYEKINSIIEEAKKEKPKKSIYTVTYSAYLNENILSLVIKATLKEGNNAQRVIIQGYNYNLSTNQIISLEEMLKVKGINESTVKAQINVKVQEAINYANNLSFLGYEVYKRNSKDEMYEIKNSNNYLLGPNSSIYIIYAYGNKTFTTEHDVVYIK